MFLSLFGGIWNRDVFVFRHCPLNPALPNLRDWYPLSVGNRNSFLLIERVLWRLQAPPAGSGENTGLPKYLFKLHTVCGTKYRE